jgi:hypothetical protein
MKNRILFVSALFLVVGLFSCKGSKKAGYSVRYTDHGATVPSPGQEPKYEPTPDSGGGSDSDSGGQNND